MMKTEYVVVAEQAHPFRPSLWGAVCVKIYSWGHLEISGGSLSIFYEANFFHYRDI